MTQPAFSQQGVKFRSRTRWVTMFVAAGAFAVLAAWALNWGDWVESWVGTMFRAMSGACLGWFISRHVDILDLSEVTPEQRPMAAVARALIIGFSILAVTSGL